MNEIYQQLEYRQDELLRILHQLNAMNEQQQRLFNLCANNQKELCALLPRYQSSTSGLDTVCLSNNLYETCKQSLLEQLHKIDSQKEALLYGFESI